MKRITVCVLAISSALSFLSACAATNNPQRPESTPRVENLKVSEPDLVPGDSNAEDPATGETSEESAKDPAAETGAMTVAMVAGTEVDVRELLDLWLFRDSPAVHDALGELIVTRISLAEAARLSLRIPEESIEAAYARGLEALAAEVERVRPGETVDAFLAQRRGIDPDMYRVRLREQSARALIAERVVRAWLLGTEHVMARAILCEDAKQLAEVEQALKDGAEFKALARDLSLAPGAGDDGFLPPITRTDSPVARLAFVTPEGEVGGPIEENGRFMLLQVVSRPEPLEGNWLDMGREVELSLEERPVHEVEWMQWEEAMFQRYEVDTSPFLKLVGEPVN